MCKHLKGEPFPFDDAFIFKVQFFTKKWKKNNKKKSN
jgi:hypothetical protein